MQSPIGYLFSQAQLRGIVRLKIIRKIRYFLFLFFLCWLFVHVSKQKMTRRWVGGDWPINFFLGFLDVFITRQHPLASSPISVCSAASHVKGVVHCVLTAGHICTQKAPR